MTEAPVFSDDLAGRMNSIRTAVSGVATNFFILPADWPAWLRRKTIWLPGTADAIFWMREEGPCWRVYYYGAPESACQTLMNFSGNTNKPVAIDILGRSKDVEPMTAILSAAGLVPHETLRRLHRLGSCPPRGFSALATVEPGQVSDLGRISQMLDKYFDPFVDQIPAEWEIKEAILLQNIRVVRNEHGEAMAFFWDERTGKTALVRYWCVLPEEAHTGAALALLDEYYARTLDCSRHVLWVRDGNHAALKCHKSYGYVPDGLIDQIFVWMKK